MKTVIISSIVFLAICTSCQKEAVLSAQANIQNITDSSALVKFSGALVNAKDINEWGIAYGTESYPEKWSNNFDYESTADNYSGEQILPYLKDSTTYNIRVYANNHKGIYYSDQVFSFTTAAKPSIPNQVGDIGPAGGTVFYSDGQGGGLEMISINNFGAWGCLSPNLPNCVSAIGSGAANTQQILNNCPSTSSAPFICDTLTYGGFNDWYLPSSQEMQLIYTNLHTTGQITLLQGTYISSTQSTASSAYCVGLLSTNGTSTNALKTTLGRYCPVRTILP